MMPEPSVYIVMVLTGVELINSSCRDFAAFLSDAISTWIFDKEIKYESRGCRTDFQDDTDLVNRPKTQRPKQSD